MIVLHHCLHGTTILRLSTLDCKTMSFLVPNEDVETLKKEVNLGKKHHKNHQIQACLNRSIGSGNPNIQFPIKFDPSNSEHVTALLTDDYFKKVVKWFIETYFKDMESKDGSAVAKKIIETCDLESQPGCSHNDNNNGAVNNMDSSCSDIEEVCDQVNLIDLSENNTRSNITSLKNLGDITTDNPCETFSMQDRDLKAENERLRKDNEVLLKMNSQLCETLNSSLKHTNENIKTLVENVCQMLKEKETTFNTNERLHAFRNEALKEHVLYKWDSQIDDIMKVPSLSEPKAIYESTLVTADLFEKRNGQGVTLLQSTSKEGPANKTAQEVPVTPDELASHAFNNFFDFNFL